MENPLQTTVAKKGQAVVFASEKAAEPSGEAVDPATQVPKDLFDVLQYDQGKFFGFSDDLSNAFT